jgi:hypothetical protein
VQPRLQLPADHLDPDATIVVEQPGAVQNGERADVLRPAEIVWPHHEEVLGGQAFQEACLGHDVTLLRSAFVTYVPLGMHA